MIRKIKTISESRNSRINKTQKIKELYTPKDALLRLKECAKKGYDSIQKEDKAVLFKYLGVFDKEKPNGKNHFMLRVRIPGGVLDPAQAAKIGEVAKKFGNSHIDITTRMQIELRYLKIEDIPFVLEELESVGITTHQTGMDNLRNIVCDPLEGLSFDSVIDSYPLLLKMQEIFLKKDEWTGTLPRKFNTSISGSFANRCNLFAHDCCFGLAQKEGIYGYNVYLGGRVGAIAKNADIFLKDEKEVLSFYETLINIFKEYGFKDNRNKNRLHFFIEAVGMKTLTDAVKEQSGFEYETAGESLVQLDHHEGIYGKIMQKNAKFALHVNIPAGIFDADSMSEASNIAKRYGKDIRLSIDQNLYITGIEKEDINSVLKEKLFERYKNINTPFFNHLISCAGSDTCSFGVIKGKSDAIYVSEYLGKRFDMKDAKIRIYWSACVKGCGIHQMGDIGLLGCKAKIDSKSVPGVDILLGGKMLNESKEAKTILKAIPLKYTHLFLEMLIEQYRMLKTKNESFEHFHSRVLSNYSAGALAFMMSFNYYAQYVCKKTQMKIKLSSKPKTKSVEAFEIFDFGEKIYRSIFNESPYKLVVDFSPKDSKKRISLKGVLDHKLSQVVEKMLKNDKTRAKVFSELLIELNIF